MGRTEWCELVSGACRLTGCVEEPEGSGHVSVRLSAEEDARRVELRIAEFRTADGTARSHYEEHGLTRASLSVESTGEHPVG